MGNISTPAKMMIVTMIQPDPKHRPKVDALLHHEFLQGYCPPSLPVSCLTMSPRFDNCSAMNYQRKPLLEINSEYEASPPTFVFNVIYSFIFSIIKLLSKFVL